jgi:hypothetical protein
VIASLINPTTRKENWGKKQSGDESHDFYRDFMAEAHGERSLGKERWRA